MLNNNKKNIFMKSFDFLHEHIIAVIIILVVLAGTFSTLYLVEENHHSHEKSHEEGVEYVDSDTVYFSMERTESLDPISSGSEDVYYVSQLIYSSLFTLDSNLSPEPEIVSDYTTDPAEGTITASLKNNVKFSDGSPLTAYDVRSTVSLIKGEGANSPYYNYVSKIDYIQVTGDYSLVVNFKNPGDAAVDNLVFPIVSGNDYGRNKNDNIGSGKYKYESYNYHKSLKLVPNEYYYGDKAENNIEVKVLPDKSKTVNLMEMDAVTAYFMDQEDADMVAEDFHLKEKPVISNEAEYLGFNFSKPVIAIKEIRQAICYAINIESIIKDNYGGSAVQSDTIFYPGFLGTENKKDAYPFDQERTAKCLEKAGYKDTDENGYVENKGGNELEFTILVNNNDKRRVLTARQIKTSLNKAGIKIIVDEVPWDKYTERLKKGDFDMYLGGYKFDKQYNLKKLFEKGNFLRYNNKAVLSKVSKLETALTADEQKAVYQDLKESLVSEIPYYCICYKTYAFLTVEHFEASQLPTFFDRFRGAESWKWQKAVVSEEPEKDKDKDKE